MKSEKKIKRVEIFTTPIVSHDPTIIVDTKSNRTNSLLISKKMSKKSKKSKLKQARTLMPKIKKLTFMEEQ